MPHLQLVHTNEKTSSWRLDKVPSSAAAVVIQLASISHYLFFIQISTRFCTKAELLPLHLSPKSKEYRTIGHCIYQTCFYIHGYN